MNRTKKYLTGVIAEIKKNPKNQVIPPDLVSIRANTEQYGKIKLNAIIYLAKTDLVIFNLLKRKKIEVPLREMKKISDAETFMNAKRKGKKALIIQLKDGGEIGLFVSDLNLWKEKLKQLNKTISSN